MAIQFRCASCGKLLQTGDETAGKRARCPDCGQEMTIPAAPAGPPPAAAGTTPYAAAGQPPPTLYPTQTPAAATATLDLNDVFSQTWEIFKRDMATCILMPLAGGILWGMIIGVAVLLVFGIASVVGLVTKSAALSFMFMLVGFPAIVILATCVALPMTRIFLMLARGQRVEFGDLFKFGPQVVPFVVTHVLFSIIVNIGVVLCVVPGVILACMFFPCTWLVIDRNLGTMEALDQARQLTNGNKLTLFLVFLLYALVAMVVGTITCGLGGFVTGPFGGLLAAVCYLRMSGQPLAGPSQNAPIV